MAPVGARARDIDEVSHGGTPDGTSESEVGVPEQDTSNEDDSAYALLEEAVDAIAGATVTGLDGKTYTKPKRKPKPKGAARDHR
jgi:hypothetical protein